jgi:aldose sugar dehydrogenase
MLFRHLFSFIVALAVAASSACAQNRDAAGRVFAEFCASCHGPRLEGGSSQSLLDDVWVTADDDAVLAEVIRDGMPDRGMPPFGMALTDPQIRSLVVYIREQRASYQRNRETLPTPDRSHVLRTQDHSFRIETVTEDVSTPWGLAWLPDGRMLVTEKPGGLKLVPAGGGKPQPIRGVPEVDSGGQGGMMEVALHPDFTRNGWIYLSFSHPATNAAGERVSMTKVVRGKLRESSWVDEQTIFEAPRELYRPQGGVHFGSRIAFDGKGYIYFTIGERGARDHAQELHRPNGKVHRLHDDGRVPKDNPFLDRANVIPSIWTYGNRNPQGLAFDPRTGYLWSTEHGPRGGDELNLIRPGLNYGWPEVTFGMEYDGRPITSITSRPDVEPPVVQWTPSIAACGLAFYTGDAFPRWKGHLLVGALAQQEVRRLVIDGDKVTHQEVIFKDFGRVRDVRSGPDGFVYIALNSPDMIVRLVPEE